MASVARGSRPPARRRTIGCPGDRAALLLGILLISGANPALGQAPAPVQSDSHGESEPATQPAALAGEDLEPDPLFDDDFALDEGPASLPDPFEKPNRGVLVFNQAVDKWLLDPITRVYRFLLPRPARHSLNSFFDNLNSPQVLVNDVFQLEWRDAGITTARLLVNTTIGLAGFFDPASSFGLERHKSDFGQTLAIAGAPSGPYFVLPLLGPTTTRGGVGLLVDALFHPTFYLLGGTDMLFFGGSAGLSTRARHFEELKALEESSVDFYAALRSGYYQNRLGEIWSRREDRRPPVAP